MRYCLPARKPNVKQVSLIIRDFNPGGVEESRKLKRWLSNSNAICVGPSVVRYASEPYKEAKPGREITQGAPRDRDCLLSESDYSARIVLIWC